MTETSAVVGTACAAPAPRPLFRTRITELLGIAHPILCGGLMWLADARYVAAAVNAGGMGFITARTFPDPADFRAELAKARELTGGKPFGVNLYLTPRDEENRFIAGHIDIALEAGVRLFETAGLPPKEFVALIKRAGGIVIHKCASVRHAVSAEKLGIDAVTVIGAECGGHPGVNPVGTIVQAARAAQAIKIPLVVGGGIGHGAQIVAALAMGADAVVLGTRMTVAEEIWAHPAYKQRLLEADETSTRLIMASFRNTYRVLDNADARAVADLEAQGVTDYERYRPHMAGTRAREAYETGDFERGALSVGQGVGFSRRIEPVAAIYAQLLREAEAALGRLGTLRVGSAAT